MKPASRPCPVIGEIMGSRVGSKESRGFSDPIFLTRSSSFRDQASRLAERGRPRPLCACRHRAGANLLDCTGPAMSGVDTAPRGAARWQQGNRNARSMFSKVAAAARRAVPAMHPGGSHARRGSSQNHGAQNHPAPHDSVLHDFVDLPECRAAPRFSLSLHRMRGEGRGEGCSCALGRSSVSCHLIGTGLEPGGRWPGRSQAVSTAWPCGCRHRARPRTR